MHEVTYLRTWGIFVLPESGSMNIARAVTFLNVATRLCWATAQLRQSRASTACKIAGLQIPCQIDNRNYAHVSSGLASAGGQIILSTLSFAELAGASLQYQLDMTRNFAVYMRKVDRLSNALLLSQDRETCRVLEESDIPCYVDLASPRPDRLPGDFGSRKLRRLDLSTEPRNLIFLHRDLCQKGAFVHQILACAGTNITGSYGPLRG